MHPRSPPGVRSSRATLARRTPKERSGGGEAGRPAGAPWPQNTNDRKKPRTPRRVPPSRKRNGVWRGWRRVSPHRPRAPRSRLARCRAPRRGVLPPAAQVKGGPLVLAPRERGQTLLSASSRARRGLRSPSTHELASHLGWPERPQRGPRAGPARRSDVPRPHSSNLGTPEKLHAGPPRPLSARS